MIEQQQHDHPEESADDVGGHGGVRVVGCAGRARPPRATGPTESSRALLQRREGAVPARRSTGCRRPLTSLDQMSVVLSQIERDGGRVRGDHLVDVRPRLDARVALRAATALSIAASTFGSLSWARLLLPPFVAMFAPLNVGSSIDCGSVKSLNQPAAPQIATCLLGHLAVLGVDRVLRDEAELDLEAELLELRLARPRPGPCPGRRWPRPSGARRCPCTCPTGSRPSSCTSAASGHVAARVLQEVVARGPSGRRPPRSPGCPAGGSASAMSPMNLPPRALQARRRGRSRR